jgi:hypothetical protein
MIMNSRLYFNNFDVIVKLHFEDVIRDFQFFFKSEEKHSSCELLNDNCIIRIGYDSGFVSTVLIDPLEKAEKEKIIRKDGWPSGYPVYPLYTVIKFLYPNCEIDGNHRDMSVTDQLLQAKLHLKKWCIDILNGDFSWTGAYKTNDARISRKIEYMTSHWSMDNPVRIKFNEGNSDWEKEFDAYKIYLDNLQK